MRHGALDKIVRNGNRKRLGLELHPEKTRLVDLSRGREGFDFLGCHLRKRMNGLGADASTCLLPASVSSQRRLSMAREHSAAESVPGASKV
jgi:hypothetical protein